MRSDSLALLQQIRDLAENPKSLGQSDEDLVKTTFKKILESGDTCSVAELENWFTNQTNAWEQPVIDRIMNVAHYQKSKFDASNKFRMISDGNECGCGGGH